ncbi:MAG: DNA-binding protein WhiA [Clostridia bacterium]|nr:DNA-binding protein WhiA [Clostridia bacterium]
MADTSFRNSVVEEIISTPITDGDSVFALVSAIAKNAGVILINKKRINLVMSVDSYAVAMYLVEALKSVYPIEFEISCDEIKSGPKKGERAFTVAVQTGFTKQVLSDALLITEDSCGVELEVPEKFAREYSLAVTYLKGLFLASGGIYVPSLEGAEEKKDGYHFEYRLEDEETAVSVCNLLASLGISAKINERGNVWLVYIKDKDEIVKILATMELGDTVMALRKIIDERETANALNRAVICETANLDKTYVAASKHLLAIGIIEESEGLESLPPALQETARIRMEFQQASYEEMAEILGVSKSCLNHRLRKLVEIADQIQSAE